MQDDLPSDKANATQLGAFYENYAILNTQLCINGDYINIKEYTKY